MQAELAIEVVVTCGDNTDTGKIYEAVKVISNSLSRLVLDPQPYTVLCKALINRVLAQLPRFSASEQDKVVVLFEYIFLHGVPSSAFAELCAALPSSGETVNGDVIARTILLFVDERTGGVDRLTQVISRVADDELVTSLIHLPSRIMNVLLSESQPNSDTTELINPSTYFASLCQAIFAQPVTSDLHRDRLLSKLIARLVLMKQTEILIATFISGRSEQKTIALLQMAPQSCIEPLIRALLSVEVDSRPHELLLQKILSSVCHGNRAARDACVYRIPFHRPLFQRAKVSLKRLAKTIVKQRDDLLCEDALITAAETWSNEEFALGADVLLQRQVTRLLLYYLHYTAPPTDNTAPKSTSSVMMTIIQGVHFRLDETDGRLRRHAMVLGEAASRHARDKELLSFDRTGMADARRVEENMIGDDRVEDGGDTDFSELACAVGQHTAGVDSDTSEEESGAVNVDNLGNSDFGRNGIVEKQDVPLTLNISTGHESGGRERRSNEQSKGSFQWPDVDSNDDWQMEDDWDSPGYYVQTSSEGEAEDIYNQSRRRDEAALREKISAPMSVARMLGLFQEMNTSDGCISITAEMVLSALRSVANRAESGERVHVLRTAAVEICLEIGRLDVERYPDSLVDELRAARERVLLAIMRLDVGGCGVAVVENVVCGKTSHVGRRMEALATIANAVQAEWDLTLGGNEGTDEKVVERLAVTQFTAQRRGEGKDLREKHRRKHMDIEGLVSIFRALAEGLCEGGGADFVDLEGRDCRVWAQGLVTLTTIARCGGGGSEGRWMRNDLLSLAVNRVGRIDGDAIVRRGISLAIGSVVDGMNAEEFGNIVQADVIFLTTENVSQVGAHCIKWLQTAEQNDADIGVRRFATMALRKWASKAAEL